MTDINTVQTTGYVVVQGVRSAHGIQEVRTAKVRRVTQSRPSLGTDEIAVKLTIRVPISAFGPFSAAAVVDIPEDLLAANSVEVTAEDANV